MVRYLFDDEDENFYYITMELCAMSLSDYFKKHGFDAFENGMIVTRIMYQCTSGVEYLHGKDIMHKDIKPANMLLSESSNLITLKLADFGMCKVLDPNKSSTVSSTKGSLGYNAPEVVLGLRNKCQSDIFSLGIVLHELSTKGKHPFSKSDRLEAELNIKQKKLPDLNGVAETPFYLLITEMLYHNWDRRPNATQVLASLTKVVGTDGDHHKLGEPIKRSVFFRSGRSTSSTNKEREKVPGSEDQPGEGITSPLVLCEKTIAGDGSMNLLKEVTGSAENQLKYTDPAVPSLPAVPTMPTDDSNSPPPKRLKSETQKKNRRAMVKKPAEKIEEMITNYNSPKSILKSETPNAQLRNAELSLHKGKWLEALNYLDRAIKHLEPMGSVKAQFLFDVAKKAAEKHLFVMSILLYACSASQFRNEKVAKCGAPDNAKCVYQIYAVTKDAMTATDTEELMGSDVRYKDIAQYFVRPLVASECAKLRHLSESKELPVFEAAQRNAYAVSWCSMLLNHLEEFTKAAELAEPAQKEIHPYCSLGYLSYLYKKQLEKYNEALVLLNRASEINKKYKKNVKDRMRNISLISKAEDNEAKRSKQFAVKLSAVSPSAIKC